MERNEQEKMSLLPPTEQQKLFPSTRYMGSKQKLLNAIWDVSKDFTFDTVLDLFSGSGVVSYMFKCHGKSVTANDYMAMASTYSRAMIENSSVTLSDDEIVDLLKENDSDHFVEETFRGLYFSDEDNRLIDSIRTNIKSLPDPYKRAIAMSALIRSCIKKRPRGIFTYTGDRYNDGRLDLQKAFEKHFVDAVHCVNNAVFWNGNSCKSSWCDSLSLAKQHYDLVYIDPPYYTPNSDNEYVRRYHFVEGLARDWQGVEIQTNLKTKKFKSYPTPFTSRDGAVNAFRSIFQKYEDSIIVVSYSSNSEPKREEMIALLSEYKSHVDVVPVDYKYSFGTRKTVKRNDVKEYLFVGW